MSIDTSREWDSLWNYDQPAESEQRFRALLPRVTDQGHRAELKTQIARTFSLRLMFDQAHAALDEVERELTDAMPVARVRYLLERGRAFNSAKLRDRARPLFLEAVDAANQAKLDGYVVDALHMLAIVEPEPAAQHEWNRRAMALAESSDDPPARRWLATLYNNIGWTYYDQKEYGAALDVFRKAIPLREQAGKVIPLRIAHYAVGKTLRAMGKLDEALAIQQRLHAEHQAEKNPDGFVCEEIAECLLARGDADGSRPWFKLAADHLANVGWFVASEPARLERFRALGSAASSSDRASSS